MGGSGERGLKGSHLSTGVVLRLLRKRIVNQHGKSLTKEGLYRRCKEIEGPAPDRSKPRTRVSFSATNTTEQCRTIRGFEKDTRVPTPHEQQILERALDVLHGFIAQAYETTESVLEAANASPIAPATSNVILARTQAPPSAATQVTTRDPVDLSGVRTLRDPYTVTSCWEPIYNRISSGLDSHSRSHTRVVCLQGRVGVGKTQVIAEWWRTRGNLEFSDSVFSRDVSRTAGGRIVRTSHSTFHPGGARDY